MKVDYLIVGQGLAGSLLAWHFLERGKRVLVVDRDEPVNSSKVAAGLVTPISGGQFSLAAGVEEALRVARETYRSVEERCGEKFFHEIPICRLFDSETEVEKWEKRLERESNRESFGEFHGALGDGLDAFRAEFGGIEVRQGGWLEVPRFLEAIRVMLLERLGYAIGSVSGNELTFPLSGGVKWRNVSAGRVIFCEGWMAARNPFFEKIRMNNARGDILTVECTAIVMENRIINRRGWLVPLGDGKFRAGATYDHDFTDDEPSHEGRREVEEKVNRMLREPYLVTSHSSAIRPIVRRSQVFMGAHPEYGELIYFNGMGSKGVTNGPLRTRELVEHLETGKPLDPATDIGVQFFGGS